MYENAGITVRVLQLYKQKHKLVSYLYNMH